ncbi:efflux RND transporter periplasmic adaptor subunit [Brevibacillus fulvus]|uniref:Multidrug resistance efflux pump n=1 Tax=Brevibacillus fulvus TaxID=1125967 RepID=A0A938Y1P0_9BACL|nr:efflux RND transporter periplasmic adaptor subunit [Brevibacillus fulvus]MBM7591680.1 multidrug resistance efflux pump [Brevibacillus fulvus]
MIKGKLQIKMISLVSVLALLAVGCSNAESSTTASSVPVVKVIKIGQSAKTGLLASGKVAADQEVQVVSKFSGKVARVNADEGSVVKQGDVLVQLDSTDYLQQVRQSESALRTAEAKLADTKAGARSQEVEQLESSLEQMKVLYDQKQTNYNRIKQLFETGAVAKAELDNATADLNVARTNYEKVKAQLDLTKAGATTNTLAALQAEVDRLRASLDLAKSNLENVNVTAPISGVISSRNIDPGEMAQAGASLLTVVKMDEVKVEASVSQDQINQIKVGQPIEVHVQGIADKTFNGTVEFVSPVSDATSSTFPIKVKVDNKEGLLRAGMLAELYLSGQTSSEIQVPTSAVLHKDDKMYVYKVDGDVVHQVEITGSEKDSNWIIVSNGVSENEQIVLNPSDALTDGSKVQVD